MGWRNLNDYRWRLTSGTYPPSTISVIEPSGERQEPDPQARRVPFGFSRVLTPEPTEPLLWEGED